MGLKERLVDALPPGAKRLLAVPYDLVQTTRADRAFARKPLVSRQPADDAPAHVVVIVVDALRGDAVDPEYAPFMASLDGTTEAIAPSQWTFPSVTSMVTGQYPHEHGSLRPADPEAEGLQLPPKLPGTVETVSEAFAGAGYDTYGGFGHDTPFVALSGRFETHALFHNLTASAADVFSAYRDWLGGRDRTFAFLHLADPHIPVDPPAAYREKHGVDDGISDLERWRYADVVDPSPDVKRYRDHRKRLYRASVEYVDDELEALTGDLPEDTTMVVTSDHGEAFWEQVALDTERFDGTGAVGHGGTPYEGVARVPLLADGLDPLTAGGEADGGEKAEEEAEEDHWPTEGATGGYVSLVDLAPTLLDLVGLSGALETTGRSLLGTSPSDGMPLIEGTMHGYEKKAVYRDEWKLIAAERASAEFELPAETLTSIPRADREAMEGTLPGWEADDDGTHVSGLVEQRLEDLGYT